MDTNEITLPGWRRAMTLAHRRYYHRELARLVSIGRDKQWYWTNAPAQSTPWWGPFPTAQQAAAAAMMDDRKFG